MKSIAILLGLMVAYALIMGTLIWLGVMLFIAPILGGV